MTNDNESARLGESRQHADPDMATAPVVPLWTLAVLFCRIGLTSVGGGIMAWMHREMVEDRRWLDEQTFLSGWAISQVMPGATPINLALYYGYRLRRGAGALVCVLGLVVPTFCVVVLMGYVYWTYGASDATHNVLVGVAAVGVGATIAIGMKVGSQVPPNLLPIAIALVTFVAVGVLHWPLVPVVLVAVPVSVLATERFG